MSLRPQKDNQGLFDKRSLPRFVISSHTPRWWLLIGTLCLVLTVGVGTTVVQLMQRSSAQAADLSVPLSGTLTPMLKQSHEIDLTNSQQRISLSLGLRPRNPAMLQAYMSDLSRPGSAIYRHFLTPAQYAALFSPTPAEYAAVQHYVQSQGFTVTGTYTHRLLLNFGGTVSQAEQAFHVTLRNYVAADKHVYYANDTAPVLPQWLVPQVLSLTGLNNAARLSHPPVFAPSHAIIQSQFCPSHGNGYLTPDQVASAYDLNGLYNNHMQGEGQTIALFELDTFAMSDLTHYAACYGQSHTPVQTVVVGSDPINTDGGVVEVELDAEMILSADPHLGRLVIYEAGNTDADSLAEWAQIVQDAVPVVSTSWGQCEALMNSQTAQEENVLFTAAAVQGQTIFAAAGDSGSADCVSQNNAQTQVSVDDPASQPYVVAVGGTRLTLSQSGGYGSETTWNDAPAGGYTGGAGGGGISQFWQAPVWQSAPGVHNTYSSGIPCNVAEGQICREVPDVALNASPLMGYPVYCTSVAAGCTLQANTSWFIVGGTSAAAPLWAAILALANQSSLHSGGLSLGFIAPLLYQVANNDTMYSTSFHDITTGTNDFNNDNGGKYPATVDYDLATGLGSCDAAVLAANLVSLVREEQGQRVSPAALTWYFAEGSVGGGFQEYITLQNPSSTQGANVTISYLFENITSVNVGHYVAASSRFTVNVNMDLGVAVNAPQQAVAAIVQVQAGGPPIVAERPMYFNYKGVPSGTDVLGATTPGTTYYFPYADTRQGSASYMSYITMLNPSATQTAHVTITYYTGRCGNNNQAACPTQHISVAPLHRGTGTPAALYLYQQLAASVQSDQPIVVERPMYFKDTIPTAGGAITGAASVVGATAPGQDWLFAEGYTGPDFQEYLVLANFAGSATTATVKLEYDNGHTQSIAVNVPAFSHVLFNVNQANAAPYGTCDTTPCQVTDTESAEVTALAPIVAERLMYFHYGPNHLSGATEAVGEPGSVLHNTFAFAEGYTANTFEEYLTVQNPTQNDETVAVTLFFDTYVSETQYLVKAHSRFTVPINTLVTPIASAYNNQGTNSFSVSMIVQALGNNAAIVAERPMYFNYHGDQGGTDVIGYTQSLN